MCSDNLVVFKFCCTEIQYFIFSVGNGTSSDLRTEMSTTDRPLRGDIDKQVMNADQIAARLPYTIFTKMVSYCG